MIGRFGIMTDHDLGGIKFGTPKVVGPNYLRSTYARFVRRLLNPDTVAYLVLAWRWISSRFALSTDY